MWIFSFENCLDVKGVAVLRLVEREGSEVQQLQTSRVPDLGIILDFLLGGSQVGIPEDRTFCCQGRPLVFYRAIMQCSAPYLLGGLSREISLSTPLYILCTSVS